MQADISQMPFPEESVSGYLLRCGALEGEDPKHTRSALVGRFPALTSKFFGWRIIPRLTRSNWKSIRRFSESQAHELAANHSIAAVYLPTTHPGVVSAMAKLFELGAPKGKEHLSNGLESIKNRPSYARMRFCPSCFHEQISEYGVAYFRRAWTVPCITSCRKHGELLVGISCPNCGGNDGIADVYRNFEQFCPQCATNLWAISTDSPSSTSLLADAWFEDLLKNPLPFLSTMTIDSCFREAANRLDGKGLAVETEHRCTRECDPFACTQRVRWMLDRRGRVDGSSLTFHVRHGKSYLDIPPFLLFWLPVIHAFETVAELHRFVVKNRPSIKGAGTAAYPACSSQGTR